ncbi:hypothetical protein [Magnetospirillum gryphiswaldense]|uniref:Secreted protein n=1 Tax=Magnetospirillum gryphiswaldense TaxID=55518 RepID=A4TWT6_9PROT|nr:hypothetical protein [Magnetospirillum gryphiswaldense]AVM74414.1 hypothetical protein MSR1_19250 [Magnetospirillum gryphiswaldense MSR-1]AVM78317.1 hypothetical protein MSR1L_19250 [Magnetospirillum gryphiswaldense]CAM75093.1 secreted protein [Magnetospirillum gryphiswaldense MSR-1]
MTKRISRAALIALPLALLAPPALASENEPDLFRSLGKFVLDGLGPARTMEDVQREERQAAAAKAQAEKVRDEEAAAKAEPVSVSAAQPAQALPAAEPEYVPTPVVHAPAPIAPVKPVKVEQAKMVVPEPKAAIVPPPPRARPVEVVRAAPPVVNLPPPEPLKSHIAATATVDQAIRLGGPAGLYGRRLMVD